MTDSKKIFDEIYSSDKPLKTSPFADYFNQKFREDISDMKNYSNRKTGFENVDRLQTFSPCLYVLGGLPALEKTSFVWQLLEQLARNGEKCICCSYEMSECQLPVTKVTSLGSETQNCLDTADLPKIVSNLGRGRLITKAIIVRKLSNGLHSSE